jgi:hypothetical protein
MNPCFTIKDVIQNPDIDWDYDGLLINPSIKLADILPYRDKIQTMFMYVLNPNLTIQELYDNPDIEFRWNESIFCKADFRIAHRRLIQRWWRRVAQRRRATSMVMSIRLLKQKLQCPYLIHNIITKYL